MQNRVVPSFFGTNSIELANGDADGSMMPALRCESTSARITSRMTAFVLCILGRPTKGVSITILQWRSGGTLVSPDVNEGFLHRCLYLYTSCRICSRYTGFALILSPKEMELRGESSSVNALFSSSAVAPPVSHPCCGCADCGVASVVAGTCVSVSTDCVPSAPASVAVGVLSALSFESVCIAAAGSCALIESSWSL